MRPTNPIIVLALLSTLCVAPPTTAQPANDTPNASSQRTREPDQREQFVRRMIQRRLDELKDLETERAQLEEVLARLDADESIEDIRANTDLSMLRPRDRNSDRARPEPNNERPGQADRQRGAPARQRDLSDEIAHDEMLSMLRDIDPRGARELEGMRERRPERFHAAMDQRRRQFAELRADREENPELFALKTTLMKSEREMLRTAREHIDSGAALDDALRTKLRPIIEQQLRAQAAIKSFQIGRMQNKLEDARAEIQAASKNPDAEIDARLDEVMQRIQNHHERRGQRSGEHRRSRDQRED